LADLRAWCAAKGIEIVGEFQDKALSGGDGWIERPGMLEAVNCCKRGTLFLVRAYDRLFRDTDKAIAFRAMLEAKGVEVRSITEEGANGESMNAKLIRFIFLWIAEYQREIIRARTKNKMLAHQASGRRMSKLVPWGWSEDPNDPKRMIHNDDERKVTDTIINLRDKGLSCGAIAKKLQETGVPCRGSKWHPEKVRRILSRE
jgi:DNA invertase Pin-like site-specific DNA recombinase